MEKIKFGVEINEDLKRRFKLEAVKRGMSLKDLFAQVLEEWLEAQTASSREDTAAQGENCAKIHTIGRSSAI